MNKVTYITGGKLVTLTHPSGEALLPIVWSLRRAGFAARLWGQDGSLIL
jgi:hypothetical protein